MGIMPRPDGIGRIRLADHRAECEVSLAFIAWPGVTDVVSKSPTSIGPDEGVHLAEDLSHQLANGDPADLATGGPGAGRACRSRSRPR